jgi:hypothetical protein
MGQIKREKGIEKGYAIDFMATKRLFDISLTCVFGLLIIGMNSSTSFFMVIYVIPIILNSISSVM